MAKFRWFDGNQGFYGFDKFDAYAETSANSAGMVLDYDPVNGPLDPEILAARIELDFANYRSVLIEQGPDAGQQQVIGGVLTSIRYLDANNVLLLEVTKLAVSLPVFLAALERGDGSSAWHLATRGSNVLTGSLDAAGAGHPGTGDVIDTGAAPDRVAALAGDDFIVDRGGADDYNGGSGYDTVSYDGWYFTPYLVSQGIQADLLNGLITGPDGSQDTVTAVEAVNGTFLSDTISGSPGANSFSGYAGNDRFDGRGGFDTVIYSHDLRQGGSDGIKVNLAAGTVRDGFGFTDRLTSIEGVEGTAQRDILVDSLFDNAFTAGAGDDVMKLGVGNDTCRGGAGADEFIFRGTNFGDDLVVDFIPGGTDLITIEQVTGFGQLSFTNFTSGGGPAVFIQCSFGTLTLLGVSTTDLSAADFGF